MRQFTQRFDDRLLGTLSGFDRLRFRGSLLLLSSEGGMSEYLWRNRVLLKDFDEFVRPLTEQVRTVGERLAEGTLAGKVHYLPTTRISQEESVQQIARKHPEREGLLAVLSCVEPCRAFTVRRDAGLQKLRLHGGERQCLHHYYYMRHRELGLLHVRLQTWFPFTMPVCLNGREWLSRQLDRAGIGDTRCDNCFTQIDDIPRAQRLFQQQLRKNWAMLLDSLRRVVHPTHRQITAGCPMDDDWSVDESEWATDLMFRSSKELAALSPRLVRHGMLTLGSDEVLRFLGRKHAGTSEVNTDLRRRVEGVRLKHRVNRNSIKMYDKFGSVLRIETTLIPPRDFKVFRPKQDDPAGEYDWRAMRKGVADLHRRAQVSQAANDRDLNRLATVAQVSAPLCQRVIHEDRSYRALNPLAEADGELRQAISRGEFTTNGFRNRDLLALLHPDTPTQDHRRRSTQITRPLKLLRMHGLIQKVPQTHRYQLTPTGQTTIATLLTARQASLHSLSQAA